MRFDVSRIGRASAIFDEQKLRWLNGRFMRELDPSRYAAEVAAQLERSGIEPPADRDHFAEACRIAQDKAQTLAEVWPLIRFVWEEPVEDSKARAKFLGSEGVAALRAVRGALQAAPEWTADGLEDALGPVVESLGLKPGKVYQPIRVAITGSTVSPGIFDSLSLLGRDQSLERISRAMQG